MAVTPSFELVGRSRELARLADFAAGLPDGPAALLIRGEPGIGKTILWREGVAAAEREGVRILVSRCTEAEMPVPLGAMSDLLDPVFEEIADELVEPQRRALAGALGMETATGTPDRLTLLRGVAAAFRALAANAPLLLAIDDAQWLDPASARVLSFAARRLGDEPIGVLETVRGTAEVPDPLGLSDALEPGAFTELAVGPLGIGHLQQLLRRRFDVRLPRSKVAAVHDASHGNPMFALEFARAAEREPADLRAQLPVPSSLQELVSGRVNALPEPTRPLLELVSAVERPTPALLAKALGDDRAGSLMDEAVSAGAIAVGTDGVVRFTHPLLGAAVYFGVPPGRRREVHRQAAALVEELEQQARHLALATASPDGEIASVVERAAYAAAERGAPDAAGVLAAEAVRLTPPDDGPARVRRTFAGAGFLMEAGDVQEARGRIEPLLDADVPTDIRARALMIRAETEHQDRRLMVRCLKEATEIAEDPSLRCQAWMGYAQHGGLVSGDVRTAVESAREALLVADSLGEPALITAATGAFAFYAGVGGRRDVEFGEEDLARLVPLPRPALWQITPAISVGALLLWAGELDRARAVLSREHEELVRQGRLLRLALVLLVLLADVEWRAGRWAEAEAYAEEAKSILDDALPGGAVVVYYHHVLLAGCRGRVDEARRFAAEGLHLTELRNDHLNPTRIRWALGHVELAGGDPAAALQSLESLPQALDTFGIGEPGWQPILPDVIEALVSASRLDEAEAVLRQLEQQATALGHLWATPAALRCRSLLLLAHERSEEAAAAAEQAAAAFEEHGFPLDRARALIAAGAARRRAGQRRRAADSLSAAIDILEELGAVLWLDRARDELRRASPRPRRDRELTSAEQQVAALVAQGHTNREVAAQLFTTVSTVEAHLTRIYRKLGIRSRAQLTRAVADGTVDLES